MIKKVEDIKVNISSTFLLRVKCKYCGTSPFERLFIRKSFKIKDVRDKLIIYKRLNLMINRFTDDWYLSSSPNFFSKNIADFSWKNDSYSPILHRTRGNHFEQYQNIIGGMWCKCGKMTRIFYINEIKPEIINRQGRYNYPQKR